MPHSVVRARSKSAAPLDAEWPTLRGACSPATWNSGRCRPERRRGMARRAADDAADIVVPPPTPQQPSHCARRDRRWKMDLGDATNWRKNPLAWIRWPSTASAWRWRSSATATRGGRRRPRAEPGGCGHSDDRVDDILRPERARSAPNTTRATPSASALRCTPCVRTGRASTTTRGPSVLGGRRTTSRTEMAILADKGILPVEGGPTPLPPQDP
jgi:hypothetical protein